MSNNDDLTKYEQHVTSSGYKETAYEQKMNFLYKNGKWNKTKICFLIRFIPTYTGR